MTTLRAEVVMEVADLRPAAIAPVSLKLTPLERFLLDCETRDTSMIIRVVLRFRGSGDAALMARCIDSAVRQHPLLCSRLTGHGSTLNWSIGEPAPAQIEPRDEYMPVSGCDDPITAIAITEQPGLRSKVMAYRDGLLVLLDAHHAATDGGGLRQLITDFVLLYHAEATGQPPLPAAYEEERLGKRDTFPQPANLPPISWRDAIRNFYVTVRGRTLRWPMAAAREHQSGVIYATERLLSEPAANAVRSRMEQHRATLNDLVLAECFRVFQQLVPTRSGSRRVTILNPTDLRMPSDRALSAANRFGFAFLRRRAVDCATSESATFIESFRDEMTYVRSNRIGAEFLKGLATASRIPGGVSLMRRLGLFVPSMQFTCLGDVTRGGRRKDVWRHGMARPGELVLESVSGFAPMAPGVPIAVAVCEAGEQISLTVCGASRYVDQDEVDRFANVLVSAISEVRDAE